MPRLVYGIRPVLEALRARARDVSLLVVAEGETQRAVREVVDAARAAEVAVEAKARAVVDEMTGGANHQGVCAVVGEYPYVEPEDLLEVARARGEAPLLVVLDGVQDPQNLGALVRTAHVLGAHGLVIPQDRASPVTPAVVRASAGATEHVKVARVVNLARALDTLKQAGLWIAGGVAEEGSAPWEVDLTAPTALVVGAEGKGIRPLVLRQCDFLARIPMLGRVASLNVSVAGALLLYEALRQRLGARPAAPPPGPAAGRRRDG
ncbi:MAG: 23S rRNA (guanosine(2251)-2'-O)-methyltransferase RlmB [Deltaproteobacteria bacterium]|nr:23S rRNA (guanosine(2251)-2'-O)-methyltransferase RlmB [Deltaproteobacteria bacterium]